MEKFESLQDLTGQESGIVVYDDNAIIVCNWCGFGGLPRVAPWGTNIIGWPDEIIVEKKYTVDDVRDVLPGKIVEVEPEDDEEGIVIEAEGMEIVYDRNGDIPTLWGYDTGSGADIARDDDGNLVPTSGTIYELVGDSTIIIAPDGWC